MIRASDDRAVRDAWESYVAVGICPTTAVRKIIFESWRRCKETGVNAERISAPLEATDDELHMLRDRHRNLIGAASPAMSHLSRLLEGSESIGLLCNESGVVLETVGDRPATDRGRENHIIPGANWTEDASGTNAVGMALVLGTPVQVRAAEHFCEGVKRWSCAAVPVHDPVDGTPIGLVDITAPDNQFSPQSALFATTAASLIEQTLKAYEQWRRACLLEYYLDRADRLPADGLVLLDHRARIMRTNDNAEQTMRRLGVTVGLAPATHLTESQSHVRSAVRLAKEHDWIEDDWLEPIYRGGEEIGLLMVIPASRVSSETVGRPATPAQGMNDGDPVLSPLQAAERDAILRAMRSEGSNLSRVARHLRISRTTLYRRLAEYAIGDDA